MKVTTRNIDHRVRLSPEIAAELREWQVAFGKHGLTLNAFKDNEHHNGTITLSKTRRLLWQWYGE